MFKNYPKYNHFVLFLRGWDGGVVDMSCRRLLGVFFEYVGREVLEFMKCMVSFFFGWGSFWVCSIEE